jgi:hypothetical protein
MNVSPYTNICDRRTFWGDYWLTRQSVLNFRPFAKNKTPGMVPGVRAAPLSSLLDLRRLRSNFVCFFSCLTRAEACLDLSLRRGPLRGDSQDFNLITIL